MIIVIYTSGKWKYELTMLCLLVCKQMIMIMIIVKLLLMLYHVTTVALI